MSALDVSSLTRIVITTISIAVAVPDSYCDFSYHSSESYNLLRLLWLRLLFTSAFHIVTILNMHRNVRVCIKATNPTSQERSRNFLLCFFRDVIGKASREAINTQGLGLGFRVQGLGLGVSLSPSNVV